MEAGELEIGTEIQTAGGTTGTVESVEVVESHIRMYNFTVAVAHTYFVGQGQWLVHNCGDKNVPAHDIFWSQEGVSWTTSDGIPLDDLSQSMASNGWKGDPLRVLETPKGNLVSLDNRRLTAAKIVGIEVPVKIVNLSDPAIKGLWAERDGFVNLVKVHGINLWVTMKGAIMP